MDITLQVPDALGHQLEHYQSRLPEVLERGLRERAREGSTSFQDENAVLEMLASQPSPEQVLTLQASPVLQSRVSDLLDRVARKALSTQEEAELDRYLVLEHLVRRAKAHAKVRSSQP